MPGNKMNYNRSIFRIRRTRLSDQEGSGLSMAASGVCSAKRPAPNGETCIGWETVREDGRDEERYQLLCNGCLSAYARLSGYYRK